MLQSGENKELIQVVLEAAKEIGHRVTDDVNGKDQIGKVQFLRSNLIKFDRNC